MGKWSVMVNEQLTDEQVEELIEKVRASKTRGLTMIVSHACDTFMICGYADTGWSKANAEVMCDSLNEAGEIPGFRIQ